MKVNELESVKSEGHNEENMFIKNRDLLEEKFHDIISENIKREREHKKEVFKKANAHAIIFKRNNEDESKKMENEDISDRAPILDILIEKWKYFNKNMKNIIEKYSRNATSLKEAFEKIMSYLGVENLDDIPDLLSKIESQMSSIQMFISNLNIQLFSLESKKSLAEQSIKDLLEKSSNNTNQKSSFVETKKDRIDLLRKKINDYKVGIAEKEKFFNDLKNPTDNYLMELESTFLSDYVPTRIKVNKEEFYNEQNITAMLANVQDYLDIIEEIEKIKQTQTKEEVSRKSANKERNFNAQINKDLDNLKVEMKTKIEMLKISNNVYSNMKDKLNSSFEETIKKMSEEIVKGTMEKKGKVKEEKKIKK